MTNAETLILIVYCLSGGILLAFIWSIITKAIYGKLIDALVINECETPESAKTLEELGVKRNLLINRALEKNRTLDRLVKEDNGKYYLPSNNKLKAQCLYGREKISIISIVITFVLFLAIIVICNKVIPLIF